MHSYIADNVILGLDFLNVHDALIDIKILSVRFNKIMLKAEIITSNEKQSTLARVTLKR